MKPKILLCVGIAMMCVGTLTLFLGIYGFVAYNKAVYEYGHEPKDSPPGSSDPYPAIDQVYQYFEESVAFFAAGGLLLVIWRKG